MIDNLILPLAVGLFLLVFGATTIGRDPTKVWAYFMLLGAAVFIGLLSVGINKGNSFSLIPDGDYEYNFLLPNTKKNNVKMLIMQEGESLEDARFYIVPLQSFRNPPVLDTNSGTIEVFSKGGEDIIIQNTKNVSTQK